MKITKKININKPIDEVWKVLAHDFDKAYEWMASIPYSQEMTDGIIYESAPMVGRVCDLSTKPDGPIVEETITFYDETLHRMDVKVVPKNGKIPVQQNQLEMTVNALNKNLTEVIWDADIELKTVGKFLYPVLKAGLSKSFVELLEELKYFVEQGVPHPRKMKKLQAA